MSEPTPDLSLGVVDITVEESGGGVGSSVSGIGIAGRLAMWSGAAVLSYTTGYESAGVLHWDAAELVDVGFTTFHSIGGAVFNWPMADGTAGQRLVTNGEGVLSWADAASVTNLAVAGDLTGFTDAATVNGIYGWPLGPGMADPLSIGVGALLAFQVVDNDPLTLGWDVYDPTGIAIAGDVTGTLGASTVVKLQGRAVSSSAPADTQYLGWSAGNNRWQPMSGGAVTDPLLAGDVIGLSSANTLYSIQGNIVVTSYVQEGDLLAWRTVTGTAAWRNTAATSLTIAGDVTGTLLSTEVSGLFGVTISEPDPDDAPQLLVTNQDLGGNLAFQWLDQSTLDIQLAGDVTGSSRSNVITSLIGYPIVSDASDTDLPVEVMGVYNGGGGYAPQIMVWRKWDIANYEQTTGEVRGKFDDLTVARLWGKDLDTDTPANGDVITFNSTADKWQCVQPSAGTGTLSGDVSGPVASNTVQRIQGRSVMPSAPTIGDIWYWSGSSWAYKASNWVELQSGYPGTTQTGNIYISGRAVLGDKLSIGTATGYTLSANESFSGASADDYLAVLEATATGATSSVTGLSVTGIGSRNGAITTVRGAFLATSVITTGNSTTTATGLEITASAAASTLLQYRKGIYIQEASGSGEIGTQYGVHIAELAVGVTNNWAVRTEGATKSYFGGDVHIKGVALSWPAANAEGVLTNDGSGTLTWEAPAATGVTSVGLSLPTEFTVTNSPVTTTGTLTATWKDAAAARVFASAAVGGANTPSFIQLLPTHFANTDANLVMAGPESGSAGAPSFRALVADDLPAMTGFTVETPSGSVNGSNKTFTLATALSGDYIVMADGEILTYTDDYTVSSTTLSIASGRAAPTQWVKVLRSGAENAVIATDPLTTKGDLWGFSTEDTRVPVGTDGYVLQADSSAAAGVSWQPVIQSTVGLTTIKETIFNGMGAQSFSNGVTYTIDGLDYLCGIASGTGSGIALSGSGLVFTHGTTDSSQDYMMIKAGLGSAKFGSVIGTPLWLRGGFQIWTYISSYNWANRTTSKGNWFGTTVTGLYPKHGNSIRRAASYWNAANTSTGNICAGGWWNGGEISGIASTSVTTWDVLVMHFRSPYDVDHYIGSWSSGWPTFDSLSLLATTRLQVTQSVGGYGGSGSGNGAQNLASMAMEFDHGWGNATAGNTYSATLDRFRITRMW